MLKPRALHHAAIRVTDVERARRFYVEVLGFKEIPRPDVPSPGAWLSLGDAQVHLIHGPTPHYEGSATRPHLAVVIDNFADASAELDRHG